MPSVSAKLKSEVIKRDGTECQYCGRPVSLDEPHKAWGLVIDHVSGRDDELGNYVVCCRSCNSSKGRRTARQWAADLDLQINLRKALERKRDRIMVVIERLSDGCSR